MRNDSTSNPGPFYKTTSPHDPLAQMARAIAISEYQLWTAIAQSLDEDGFDASAEFSSIGTRIGQSKRTVEANIFALTTLAQLPQTKAMQDETFLLDMNRLRAIDRALASADASYLAEIDAQLLQYLTPTRANQILPSAKKIFNKIQAILAALDATLDADPAAPSPDGNNVSIHISGANADLHARLGAADAAALNTRIKATADKLDITCDEAFKQIILGNGVNITVNLYKAMDIPNAPGWTPQAGWLTREQTQEMLANATRTRLVEQAAHRVSPSYSTPPDIEAYLDGRDGRCRFPECTVHPHNCDNDHRINHADGGPTAAANMIKLCRHHHNMKTAKRIHYLLDPDTDDVYWLFADGTWLIDNAEGPLSTPGKQWLQTAQQRYEKRNERARRKAQEHARQHPRQTGETRTEGERTSISENADPWGTSSLQPQT